MSAQSIRKAMAAHRQLLRLLALLTAVTAAECIYLRIPLADFSEFKFFLSTAIVQFCTTMLILGALAFVRYRFSWRKTKERAQQYFASETFWFGVPGAFILSLTSVLFIFQKCFVYIFNPFDYWDPVFAEWDRWLHFGRYPHEYYIMAIDRFPWIAKLLDQAYAAWFVALSVTGVYCLYWDRDFRRRMHFMWTYMILFMIVGSLAAIAFASAGPVFFHDFYPDIEDPYAGFLAHLAAMDEKYGLLIVSERHWLLDWTRNAQIIDPNSIAAMPSMHNATMLFCAFYWRSVNRWAFAAACVMVALVFFSSIYTGFHYAVDAYVAYIMVIIIWFWTKPLMNKLYPQTENMVLSR